MHCVVFVLFLFGFFENIEGACPSTDVLIQHGLCARLYEHSDCTGRFIDVPLRSEVPVMDLNDHISSLIVAPSMSITVYEHSGFSGQGREFTVGSIPRLASYGRGWWGRSTWNDVISSYTCREIDIIRPKVKPLPTLKPRSRPFPSRNRPVDNVKRR